MATEQQLQQALDQSVQTVISGLEKTIVGVGAVLAGGGMEWMAKRCHYSTLGRLAVAAQLAGAFMVGSSIAEIDGSVLKMLDLESNLLQLKREKDNPWEWVTDDRRPGRQVLVRGGKANPADSYLQLIGRRW